MLDQTDPFDHDIESIRLASIWYLKQSVEIESVSNEETVAEGSQRE